MSRTNGSSTCWVGVTALAAGPLLLPSNGVGPIPLPSAIVRLRSSEPPPTCILPPHDIVWTARHTVIPPRAAVFLSAICSAVRLALVVLFACAMTASEQQEHRRMVSSRDFLFSIGDTP